MFQLCLKFSIYRFNLFSEEELNSGLTLVVDARDSTITVVDGLLETLNSVEVFLYVSEACMQLYIVFDVEIEKLVLI